MHKVFISYHHANDQWYKNALMPKSDLTGTQLEPACLLPVALVRAQTLKP